jgi:mannosyltransferase
MAGSRPNLWLATAACMAVAAALRFPGLMAQSLWIDEIYSVDMASWPLEWVLSVQDGHPPIFALLHKLVAGWIDPEVAGRAIAAVAGVLAVGALVWLATELWDLRVGVVAGVLLAVSPLHVWYSQEGRSYALLALIAILASHALVVGARRGGWRVWTAFGVLSFCGLFTHYLYAGVLLAQVIFLAWVGGQSALLLAIALVMLVGAASVPVLGREATSFVGEQRGFEWLALPYAGFTYIGGFGLGPSVEALHRDRSLAVVAGEWPAIAAVTLLAAACVLALPRALRGAGPFGSYVVLWALAPPLFVFAGSWLRDGAFNVRYAITALPGIVLCLALVLTSGSMRRLALGLCAFVALSAVSIQRERSDPRYLREDFRSAGAYLAAHAVDGDRVVVAAHYAIQGVAHYYRGSVEPLPVRPLRSVEDAAANLRTLETAPGGRGVWIVLAREWDDDPAGHLEAALGARGVPPATHFPGVRIFRLAPSHS